MKNIFLSCDDLDKIELNTEPYIQSAFLHGCCDIFALAMHDVFGLDIYLLKDEENQVVHYFCIKDESFYDIRGFSKNLNCFLEEFEDFIDINSLEEGYANLSKINDVEKLRNFLNINYKKDGDNIFNDIYNQAILILKNENRWLAQ